MHIDLDQTAPQKFESTVCIVGAGIAGILLATRLQALGIDVHLLEAGGLEQESRSQAFYATEQAATPHRGATEGRFRTFGGSSTQWGGQLLPFTRDIFTPHAAVPSLPWPITEDDLAPFYDEIQRTFTVDPMPFSAELLRALHHPPVPFSADMTLRFSKWAPFKKRNLSQSLGPSVLSSPRLTLFTHANVASLEGAGGRIESIRVLNYAGQEFHFSARQFVAAAGTIENSRILLNSSAVPNPHDQIGRYFHDHLSYHAGRFQSPAREAILERLGPFFVEGTLHTCKIEASPASREREHLYAAMAHIVILEPEDSGMAAVRNLLRSLQSGRLREAVATNLAPMLRGAGDILRLLFYAKWKRRRAVSKRAEVLLNVDVEQAPDTGNRILLSEQKDALGLPIAIVDWRVRQPELDTAATFSRMIRAELQNLNLSSIEWHPSLDDGTAPPMLDTYHAMGGLRMGTDPAASVVDADLKVHQLTNLYVASCAVFPSGSSSNPTFTMIALTLRLADHLASRILATH